MSNTHLSTSRVYEFGNFIRRSGKYAMVDKFTLPNNEVLFLFRRTQSPKEVDTPAIIPGTASGIRANERQGAKQ